MGLRYRKTVRVAKHTKVNLGARQASVSVGQPGLTVNLSRRGAKATVGLPGTGLSYVTKPVGGNRKRGSLFEEVFAVVFIVVLLGTVRFVWRLVSGIARALFLRSPAQAQALPNGERSHDSE
jgi:hypothetical protein